MKRARRLGIRRCAHARDRLCHLFARNICDREKDSGSAIFQMARRADDETITVERQLRKIFSGEQHQASDRIWGTVMDGDCAYSPLDI